MRKEFLEEIKKELINIDKRNNNIIQNINIKENHLEFNLLNYQDFEIDYFYLFIDNYDFKLINSENEENIENDIYNLKLNYIQFEDNISIIYKLIYNFLYEYFKYRNNIE